MRDGVTPLSEDFFNEVFGDLDARIADLEDRRKTLQSVIDELTGFGLERINATLIPVMQSIDAALQGMLAKKDELNAAIERAGALASVADLTEAILAERQARENAIGTEQAERRAAIAAAIAQPTETAITYDGDGRVVSVTETVDGLPRETAITYTGGLVDQIVTTHGGRRRTETYTYAAGRLTGSTAAEETL